MSEKIASLYAEISADTSKLQKGLSQTKGQLSNFKGSLNDVVQGVTGFSLASIGVATTLVAIANGVKKATIETVAYNKSIRDLANISKLSTEETSRIVQVADDYGISIGGVKTALQWALKNGFKPSIETLAQMADAYNAAQNPAERAAQMTKVFGRNWSELTPLLAAGGAAIREGAAAISDSLIVTEQAAQASRRYEIAVDGLNNAWTGFKMNVGNAVIPTLTDLINGLNETSAKAQIYQSILQKLPEDQRQNAIYADKWNGAIQAQVNAIYAGMTATEGYVGMQHAAGASTSDLTSLLDGQASVIDGLSWAFGDLTNELMLSTAAAGMNKDQIIQMARDLGVLNDSTYSAVTAIQAVQSSWIYSLATEAQQVQMIENIIAGFKGLDSMKHDYYFYVHTINDGQINVPLSQLDYATQNPNAPTAPKNTPKYAPITYGGGGESAAEKAAREAQRKAEEERRKAEEALRQQIQAQQSKLSTLMGGAMGKETETYASEMEKLVAQQKEITGTIADLNSQQWLSPRQKNDLETLKTQLEEVNAEIKKSGEEHQKATKKILFDILQQQLSMDGLTLKESDFLMSLASAWGLIDRETLNAWNTMKGYVDQLNKPGADVGKLISTITGDTKLTGKAAGGPVLYNKAYWVGENGPELFLPRQTGQIVPAGQSAAVAAPGPMYFYITSRIDEEAMTQRIVRRLQGRN